ncbi:MAG: hypothetical protein FJW63_10010 [Actinobacteria bacterium]|nr:hypothetical protein [Actinomycetota bacterium]
MLVAINLGSIKIGVFDKKPNISKLEENKDINGLIKALGYKKVQIDVFTTSAIFQGKYNLHIRYNCQKMYDRP